MKKHLKLNSLLVLPLALTMLIPLATKAQEEEETDFKSSPPPDTRRVDKLGSEVEHVSLDMEMEEAGEASYNGVANEASAEEHRLKLQIGDMERQIISLKSGTQKAKKDAELATARLELQKKKMNGVRQRHIIASKEKEKVDKKLEKINSQLRELENEETELKQKTNILAQLVKEEQSELAAAKEKIKKTQARINEEKKRQAALQKKRTQIKNAQNQSKNSKRSPASTRSQ